MLMYISGCWKNHTSVSNAYQKWLTLYRRSVVINYLEQTFQLIPDTRIAFIYFYHKENPSSVNLLGNVLKQILQQQTNISSVIHELYQKNMRRKSPPSLTEISEL